MDYKCNMQELLTDLNGLMKIESTNNAAGKITKEAPLGEGIKRAIDYVLSLGKSFGFKTKSLDGYCGYVEMGEGEEILGILTHVDTVEVGDDWSVPPFELTIDGDKAFGRGVLDDKGLTMVSLYAMKALAEAETPLNKRIRLIVGGDEESGNWKCMDRYKETEEIPVIGFSPDAGYPVIFAEKGILKIKLEKKLSKAEGFLELSGGKQINSVPAYAEARVNDKKYETLGKLAHASEPELGINAILLLVEELKKAGIKHSFLDLGEIATKSGFNIELSDEISGELTLNPAIASVNEEVAILECDIRYPISYKADEIKDLIADRVKIFGFSCEIEQNLLPLHVDRNGFLIKTLEKVYKEYTGDNAPPAAIGGGTYARAFDNTVAFGGTFPGEENRCHQTDEYWSIKSMEKNFYIIAKALAELGA